MGSPCVALLLHETGGLLDKGKPSGVRSEKLDALNFETLGFLLNMIALPEFVVKARLI